MNPSSNYSRQILVRREMASAMDPLKVKQLAMTFRLTQAQVRALFMKHGGNWMEFIRAAQRLRAE